MLRKPLWFVIFQGWGGSPLLSPFLNPRMSNQSNIFIQKIHVLQARALYGPRHGNTCLWDSNQVGHKPENKCADQTVWLHMLVCTFVVCMQHIQVYSGTVPNYMINKKTKRLCVAHSNLIRFTMLINWYNLTSFSCLKSVLHRHLIIMIIIIIIIVFIFRG